MLYIKVRKRWPWIIPSHFTLYDDISKEDIEIYEEKINRKTFEVHVFSRRFLFFADRAWLAHPNGSVVENGDQIATLKTAPQYQLDTAHGSYFLESKTCWRGLKIYYAIHIRLNNIDLGEIVRLGLRQADRVQFCYEKLAHTSDKELVLYAAFRLASGIAATD